MKRVRKKRGWVYRLLLINGIALVVSTGCLWVYSIFWHGGVTCPLRSDSWSGVYIHQGLMVISCIYNDSGYLEVVSLHLTPAAYNEGYIDWWWFGWESDSNGWYIGFPLWLPILLFSIWPVNNMIHWVQNVSLQPGFCADCGYDLRGSVGSAACPECGALIQKKQERGRVRLEDWQGGDYNIRHRNLAAVGGCPAGD